MSGALARLRRLEHIRDDQIQQRLNRLSDDARERCGVEFAFIEKLYEMRRRDASDDAFRDTFAQQFAILGDPRIPGNWLWTFDVGKAVVTNELRQLVCSVYEEFSERESTEALV